jgi:cellulose synthase/poly-beta-1,6-N-acetylglucosamine synthase-like glycosyltransferase
VNGGAMVSVVVPVHNGARFLGEALRSAVDQDYAPIEVIVVDDGSTDASEAVARSFPVRYLHQENRGPAAARNTGIETSRGPFIAFLDADDMMLPHKLRVQVGHLVEHPEVDCVLARQEVRVEDGVTPPAWLREDRLVGDAWGVPPLSAVVRREVLERIGGFDPRFRVSEDLDLLFRLRASGAGIRILEDVVMIRRLHGANLTYATADLRSSLLRSVAGRVAARRRKADG